MIVSKPNHGQVIAKLRGGDVVADNALQVFLDDVELLLNARLLGESVRLPVYTVATLPPASRNIGGSVFVSNAAGGAITAFSDGTNWRRSTDRAIVT